MRDSYVHWKLHSSEIWGFQHNAEIIIFFNKKHSAYLYNQYTYAYIRRHTHIPQDELFTEQISAL